MRSTLNNACISALLCSSVLIAIPAIAAGTSTGAAPNANPAVPNNTVPTTADGRSTITGGAGDQDTATTVSNARSVGTTAPTSAHRMDKKAQANANAAEVENTRQLNQQQTATGAHATASATVQ